MRIESGSGSRTVSLERDETLRLPRGRHGIVTRVERGTVLVTQAGDPEDHVLCAGEEIWIPAGGLAVAWALTSAAITVAVARATPIAPEHVAA